MDVISKSLVQSCAAKILKFFLIEQLFYWWNLDLLKNIFLLHPLFLLSQLCMKGPEHNTMALKSAILYKIVNNLIEKMHLSEIQLEKFMRQHMNTNKSFFIAF